MLHKWPQGEKHIYKERLFSFLRWLLEKKNVSSVAIGVKNLEQLEDNLGSVGWKMSAADLKLLDDVSSLPEPYPYEMVNRLNINRKR